MGGQQSSQERAAHAPLRRAADRAGRSARVDSIAHVTSSSLAPRSALRRRSASSSGRPSTPQRLSGAPPASLTRAVSNDFHMTSAVAVPAPAPPPPPHPLHLT